jgi:hypothetical protein
VSKLLLATLVVGTFIVTEANAGFGPKLPHGPLPSPIIKSPVHPPNIPKVKFPPVKFPNGKFPSAPGPFQQKVIAGAAQGASSGYSTGSFAGPAGSAAGAAGGAVLGGGKVVLENHGKKKWTGGGWKNISKPTHW